MGWSYRIWLPVKVLGTVSTEILGNGFCAAHSAGWGQHQVDIYLFPKMNLFPKIYLFIYLFPKRNPTGAPVDAGSKHYRPVMWGNGEPHRFFTALPWHQHMVM